MNCQGSFARAVLEIRLDVRYPLCLFVVIFLLAGCMLVKLPVETVKTAGVIVKTTGSVVGATGNGVVTVIHTAGKAIEAGEKIAEAVVQVKAVKGMVTGH